LAVIVAFWMAIALVLMAVLGWLFFGEKLSTRNAARIALVLMAFSAEILISFVTETRIIRQDGCFWVEGRAL
jgi:multidrug transporter EmrE-like cation transporter